MQKKWIAGALACLLMAGPGIAFAEDNSLDENYIDAIFGKLEDMNEKDKEFYKTGLMVNIGGDSSLEDTQENWEKSLTEAQKKELDNLGISNQDVENNLEKLKSWSIDDRIALVEAAADGDESTLRSLNNKYKGSDNSSSDSGSSGSSGSGSSGGGSGGSGGGSGSGGSAPATVVLEEEATPEGSVLLVEAVQSKGLKAKPLEIKHNNKIAGYTDMEKHWSKEYVSYFMDRDIISGRSETSFDPDASISKAEIMTLLSKLIVEDSSKIQASEAVVSDMTDSDWFKPYVDQLMGMGVISPDANGKLNPNTNPERQEIVSMLMQAIEVYGINIESTTTDFASSFTDANMIKADNLTAMENAVAIGLIKGMGDGRLAPTESVTRGQIAVMLKNFHDYVLSRLEEETA